MGEDRTGEPQTNQRLTVAQAAMALGITEGAVRSRIKRGTLPTLKEGGTVYVLLSGTSGANHTPHTDELSNQSELIAVLREQLAEEREARRRADTIIAQLTQANATLAARIPELEAPPEPREPPEGGGEPSESAEPRSTTEESQEPTSRPQEERSWWRRMFGG